MGGAIVGSGRDPADNLLEERLLVSLFGSIVTLFICYF